jgi:hypothetical protein
MLKVICPLCESQAVSVSDLSGSKFYCARCGWNLEIARAALSSAVKVNLSVVALGVILGAVALVRNPNESWAGALLALFCGLPLVYALQARYRLRKLKNLSVQPTNAPDRTVTVSESGGDKSKTIAFKDKEFPEWTKISRPRRLRMTWKGRGYFVIALLVIGLYTLYGLPAAWTEFNRTSAL